MAHSFFRRRQGGDRIIERIEGRTAFVTGAAGGIGLAIAKALLGAGARVVIADVDAEELTLRAGELGDQAAPFVLDVTDRARWAAGQAFVEQHFGPVDILVNNAGLAPDMQLLADMAPESFDAMLRVQLTGTFNGVHTFASGLRARGEGHILNTASIAGMSGGPRLGAYTAAKFGVVGLSEVLQAELAPHGVGVSVLCPGLVKTRMTRAITEPADGSPAAPALDASVVGALALDAIRANRLYVFTHGEHRDGLAERNSRLLSAFEGVPRRDG